MSEKRRGGQRPGAGRPVAFKARKGDFLILERENLHEDDPFTPPQVVRVLDVTETEIEAQDIKTEAIITLRFPNPEEITPKI